jgi:hypothetical protein
MAGATSDTLLLPNSTGINGGFSVVICDSSGCVTSTPAVIWADSNGNGIPDWWEMQYFGNLNQTSDGDGVNNLDEYLEGTNPTNAASYNPRLYVEADWGSVVVSPDLPYYTMGQIITLTAIPDDGQTFLGWSGATSGTKSTIALVMNNHHTEIANFGLPLGVALVNTNLFWSTGGDALWSGQTDFSYDGFGSAQSGIIEPGQQSLLQGVTTNLTQAMQLSFWWEVSSQPPDVLTFSIDGNLYSTISGSGGRLAVFPDQFATGQSRPFVDLYEKFQRQYSHRHSLQRQRLGW